MNSTKTRNPDVPIRHKYYVDARCLCGEWVGHSPRQIEQTVRIDLKGTELVATKVTGNSHVPAGEITWKADLKKWNGCYAPGQGKIANDEYVNPRFVPGYLSVLTPEKIIFYWVGDSFAQVTYRKDD